MNHEIDELVELENIRFKHQALASNPSTSPEYIKSLYETSYEETPPEDEPPEDGEWFTPQSPDEIEDVLSRMSQKNESQTPQS